MEQRFQMDQTFPISSKRNGTHPGTELQHNFLCTTEGQKHKYQ